MSVWTSGITSFQIPNVSTAKTVYVEVLVRDQAGNTAFYKTALGDLVPPVPVGLNFDLTVSNVGEETATLKWGLASDNLTATTALQYKVVHSPQDNIGTLSEIENNGATIVDWTTHVSSAALTALRPGSTHYLNVLVRDEWQNVTAYFITSLKTSADKTAPTPGSNGLVTVAGMAAIDLSWARATDLGTDQSDLEYAVYTSTSKADLSDAQTAISNGTEGLAWTKDIASAQIQGITEKTTYFVAVLVRDEAGNIAIYELATFDRVAPTSPSLNLSGGNPTDKATAAWSTNVNGTKDDITAYEQLEFRIVLSTDGPLDTLEKALNGQVLKDWFSDATKTGTTELSGLPTTETWWLALLIRDKAGNIGMAASGPLWDLEPPVVSDGTLTLSALVDKSATVQWQSAVDDITTDPQYKVVYSESPNIVGVADIANGALAQDWKSSVNTATLTDLKPNTTYYVNVFSRDSQGNTAAYTMANFVTAADSSAPSPGVITLTAGVKSFSILFTAATDGGREDQLQYRVVYSEADDLNSIGEAEAKVQSDSKWLLRDWSTSTEAERVDGIVGATDYWAVVLVKDPDGNTAIYSSVKTQASSKIYLWSPGFTFVPNFTPTGTRTSRREQADYYCESNKPQSDVHLLCDKTIAFISFESTLKVGNLDLTDQIADFDLLYGVPMSGVELWGPAAQIADDLAHFLDKTRDITTNFPASKATQFSSPSQWLSFSNHDGTVRVGHTCHSPGDTSTAAGNVGTNGATRIEAGTSSPTCNSANRWLMCVCF